jgi:hypothetical protein
MCKNMWTRGRKYFLQGGSLGHPAKRGGQPLVACQPWPCQTLALLFSKFFHFILFSSFFEVIRKFGDGPGILG